MDEKQSGDHNAAPKPVAPQKTRPAPKEHIPSLVVTYSPHIGTEQSIEKIMYMVALALAPACLASIYFFGLRALLVLAVSVAGCLAFEAIFIRLMQPGTDWKRTTLDGSAIVTGLLLGMNLSAGAPVWMIIAGCFVAMFIGKHVYGGLGQNPFNPALVARVFLLISFPREMTKWVAARGDVFGTVDAASFATPLNVLKLQGAAKAMGLSKMGLFLGSCGGCLGETSALALLIGGVFLIALRIIRWHIPVSFIGTVFIFTGILWLVNPQKYADPFFHILTGGVMLGAIFMATDMVTSPITGAGMIVFGVGCGALTTVIRVFGIYPEGVSFAILIMNGMTPLIDRYVKGRRYGLRPVMIPQKS